MFRDIEVWFSFYAFAQNRWVDIFPEEGDFNENMASNKYVQFEEFVCYLINLGKSIWQKNGMIYHY